MEYSSEFERDFDILMRKYTVDMMKCETAYILESMQYEMMYEDGEENTEMPKSKIGNALQTMIQKMRKLLRDLGEMFHDMFGKNSGELTIDDFKNSDLGKIQLEYDLDNVQAIIDNEMAEGRRLVKLIARGKNVEPREAAAWVDSIKAKLHAAAPTAQGALNATSCYAFTKLFSKRSKHMDDTLKMMQDDFKSIDANQDTIGKLRSGFSLLLTTFTKISGNIFSAIGTYKKHKNDK